MSFEKRICSLDDVTRRDFIAGAARGLLGIGGLPFLSQAVAAAEAGLVPLGPATARNVIYVFLAGGMSHIDTLDPKPGSETQGPVEAIRTNADDILLSQYLPNLARRMDKVALVRSLSSKTGAHAEGRYFMHTSYEKRGTIRHPNLGAWVSRLEGTANPTLPGHVSIGNTGDGSGGFLDSRHHALPIGDPEAGLQHSSRPAEVSDETFHRRLERLQQVNRDFATRYDQTKVHSYDEMFEQAVKLMNSTDLAAFDISQEPQILKEAYGAGSLGRGCMLARRLVEHGVRFVEVVDGGWDTHNQNFDALEEKVPVLDRAIATLLSDLESRGMLEETLVVVATEFGRTPEITTDRMGRDHYPRAFSSLLAGGGIRGGQAHGKTDPTGAEVIENAVSIPDFNATIAHALGLPLDHVETSPSGRPFTIADKGKPIRTLFG